MADGLYENAQYYSVSTPNMSVGITVELVRAWLRGAEQWRGSLTCHPDTHLWGGELSVWNCALPIRFGQK